MISLNRHVIRSELPAADDEVENKGSNESSDGGKQFIRKRASATENTASAPFPSTTTSKLDTRTRKQIQIGDTHQSEKPAVWNDVTVEGDFAFDRRRMLAAKSPTPHDPSPAYRKRFPFVPTTNVHESYAAVLGTRETKLLITFPRDHEMVIWPSLTTENRLWRIQKVLHLNVIAENVFGFVFGHMYPYSPRNCMLMLLANMRMHGVGDGIPMNQQLIREQECVLLMK
jgi:hypothetical protein